MSLLHGSAPGGIPEYVRPGRTGGLNASTTGEELADIMLGIIRRPEPVLDLHRSVVARREALVKPMDVHLRELSALYGEVIAARRRSLVPA